MSVVVEHYEEVNQERGRMLLLNMTKTKCVELRSLLYNLGNDGNLGSKDDNGAVSQEKVVAVNSVNYYFKFSSLKPDMKIEIKCPYSVYFFVGLGN